MDDIAWKICEVLADNPPKREALLELVSKRWEKMHSPLYAAAAALNPKGWGKISRGSCKVKTSFMAVVEAVYPTAVDEADKFDKCRL